MFFFTADQHFDHDNIIRHCNRPFKSVHMMNLELIDAWNKVVRGKDVVVICGDFAWEKNPQRVVSEYSSKLNGNLIFIKGNHDYWWTGPSRHIYRNKVAGIKVFCCHYPMRSWVHGYNLHGHCHGTLPPWKNQLDVGVDNARTLVGSYRPLSIVEVDLIIQRQNKEIAHAGVVDYHAGETENLTRVLLEHNP